MIEQLVEQDMWKYPHMNRIKDEGVIKYNIVSLIAQIPVCLL